MSETVIKVENLGKKYFIKHEQRERYTALRDVMAGGIKKIGRKLFSPKTSNLTPKTTKEDFWALKDVSFEIKQGERVGIIGRNGVGKTTLLKLLSRITEPTTGRITLKGRVASLLEVGTGFHPELTGRENIFLNGAILGMSKVEIKKKFDEIVDFAEIEKFLDTPVKRYSSGMYVRLAFAVAAHLEPEILLVDEVLAVGDAQFQKKCLGKMEDIGKEGRTVIFVSHNMGAVVALCPQSILLESGSLMIKGDSDHVINEYLSKGTKLTEKNIVHFNETSKSPVYIKKAAILNDKGEPAHNFYLNNKIFIQIDYVVVRNVVQSFIIIAVSRDGIKIFQSHDTDIDSRFLQLREAGQYRTIFPLPSRLLTAGQYYLTIRAAVGSYGQFGLDDHPDALRFSISSDDEDTTFKGYADYRNTLIISEIEWQTQKIE
jgi:lipopolysaccharide transport system ATP-binding protein